MREATPERERWEALIDREARGDALSPEERDFCDRFEADEPMAARERELLDELEVLDAPPDPQSSALVDRTLAALADEARVREDKAVSRMRGGRERTTVVLIGGGALAVAAALALAVLRTEPAEPIATPQGAPARMELVYASGDVRIDGATPKRGAELLDEGSTLAVGEGGACIAMDPAIDVCVSAHSKLRLTRTHSPWRRLDLLEGSAGAQLGPQPEGMRFSIVGGDIWSTAIGTAFTVVHDASGGVRTTVLNGKVEVGPDGHATHVVAAHQRARIQGEDAQMTSLTRTEESTEWALLRPTELWSDPVSASLNVDVASGAEVLLDSERVGLTPLSSLVPIGRHQLALRANGRIVYEQTFVARAGHPVGIDVDWKALLARSATPVVPEVAPSEDVTPRASEPTLGRPATPVRTPAAALREARKLMRTGRYADAAAQYEALHRDFPGSPEARTVLVPLAQLELDRLGRPERALVHAERYLQGPPGALAQEARYARVRALAALGQTRQEIDAIEEFLELHATSLRAHRLEERLRELQHGR